MSRRLVPSVRRPQPPCPARCAATLLATAAMVVIAVIVAPASAPAAITGHSIVSNCGGEAGNFVTITFTSDEPVTLDDVRWDFTDSPVWYDDTGVSFCPTINDGLTSAVHYLVPPGDRAQIFGLTCTGFDSGDAYQHGCDLDRGSGGTPFTDDFLDGTVTCTFSDGTVLVGVFDQEYDAPNGARADLAEPMPDLEFHDRPGWYAPVVPRPDATASWTSVPAPSELVGDAAQTWFSACCYNAGDQTAPPSQMILQLDDLTVCSHNLWTIAPGSYNGWTDDGPHTVRGGRHTVVAIADAGGVIEESDESDNVHARQWIWAPPVLTMGQTVTRAAPPAREAGFQHLGPFAFYNCDGVRIAPSASDRWNVVWMVPQGDPAPDYALRLHQVSTSPTAGFQSFLASTQEEPGLDALIVNAANLSALYHDVGVLNTDGGAASEDYRLQHLGVSPYPFDFGIFPQSPYFVSRVGAFDFSVGSGDLGAASLVAVTDPDHGPVKIGWLGPTFNGGTLADVQGVRSTGTRGWAICNLDLTQTGHHGAFIWGDPDAHPGSLAVRVGLFQARADLYPSTLFGWYAPIVPRPDDDAVLFGCGLPDTLHGGGPFTFLNTAAVNGGSADADTVSFALKLDGWGLVGYRSFSPLPPGNPRVLLNLVNGITDQPWTIPGGRHTLSVEVDYLEDVAELLELNNLDGRQYCWSPRVLGVGEVLARTDLPAREGGHEECAPGVTLYPNCDGLRLQHADMGTMGRWRGAAVVPDLASQDVDVELHEPLIGAVEGFGPHRLAESTSGPGEVDFVLVHYPVADPTDLDVGVIDAGASGAGGADYTIQDVVSAYLGHPGLGPVGPFTLPAGRMVQLFELDLPAGPMVIRLDDLGAGIPLGLAMYRGDQPYRGKHDTLPGGYDVAGSLGESAAIAVDVPAAGSYALAVWKCTSGGLDVELPYRLWVTPGATGVEDGPGDGTGDDSGSWPGDPAGDVPLATRLLGAAPNPCNPRAVIAFELAEPGPCDLSIHDVSGRRVRHLVDRELPAGRHEAVFDGRDRSGRALPSGIYLIRLRAGEVRELRKLTLVR